MRKHQLMAIHSAWVLFLLSVQCPGAEPAATGRPDLSGFQGGLIVQVGCGDGSRTAELGTGANRLVHALDSDAAKVAAARKQIASLGLYGRVSVDGFDGRRLPYVDNLVSLLVSEDLGGVSMDEVLRVLAPLGIAHVKRDGQWTRTVKPWPAEIDEWPQHYHGADNNAVAHDRVVGPPRHLQWTSEPEWTRSHLTIPSITSFISARGRLFTVEDRGSAEHPALPGRFTLVARDAFNGVELWKRPFPDWHPVNIYIKFTPAQLQRRLAAVGDILYCTPGFSAPLTALDAATGKQLKVYEGTERTQEFAVDRGILFLVIGDPYDTQGIGDPKGGLGSSQFEPHAYGPIVPKLADPKSTLVAIEAESGRKLWEKAGRDTAGYQGTTLAVRGERAVYCTTDALVCLERTTGRQVWRVQVPLDRPDKPGMSPSLVLSDDTIYLADAKNLRAFALEDGAKRWTGRAELNHFKAPDVFLANGLVWSAFTDGHDPKTGQIVKTLHQKMNGPMSHNRCYRNRITDRYYIDTMTGGSDFVGLDGQGEFPHPWGRSTCGIGHLPCNGLLYLGPPACSCCNWVMLNALNALAPEPGLKSSGQPIPVERLARLEKGPAYGALAQSAPPGTDDWPTYRHDAGRTGVTRAKAPAGLKPCWEAKVSTRASAPVIAAGKVFLADVDAHAVCALEATNGKELWRFTTGGRVDSPPTWHEGLLLFGSRDGWVYCLRAADGELAWRFKDLPDRAICSYGQIESAWPVCGSVLIRDGVACFAAGRNSFLDGGIFLYGLEPATGRVVHQRQMYGPYGEDGFPIIASSISSGFGLHGFKNDVFSSDEELLYLRQQAFRPDLTPLKPEEITRPHLIPSPGFLEAIPHHRTFWTIDTTIRYDIAAGHGAVHGDILVLDGRQFYESRGYVPGRAENFDPRPNGYTLYAGTLGATAPDAEEAVPKKSGAAKKMQLKPRRASGATAAERWSVHMPITGKAMALAGDTLFVAGTPVVFPANDLAAGYEGRLGGVLWAVSAEKGEKAMEVKLAAPPVWDSLAVAGGRLYIATTDGVVRCYGGE